MRGVSLVFDLQLFAEGEERREAATPRRRQQARERGQVFRSPDLGAALAFLGAVGFLHLAGPWLARHYAAWAVRVWSLPPADWSLRETQGLGLLAAGAWAAASLPLLLLVLAVGVVVGLVQTGFALSPAGLLPRWEHLNPAWGFRRLLSLRSGVELAKALLKVTVVGAVALAAARHAAADYTLYLARDPAASFALAARWAGRIGLQVGGALLALAVADFFYQRWEYERNLRMSRTEVKEEIRETEGDPAVRGARRRRQRELARRRMVNDVRRAQVVVTNPVHVAVALRYVAGETDAPVVVAKGRGYLAQRIRAEAEKHGVPVVEDPPLARTLYRLVRVGQAIPQELYAAVAEVLAFVWRLKGGRF